MAELERTADAQIPTLRKLRGAAPELTAFLRDAEPFARASRTSIDDLGRAAGAGRAAIRQSSEEVGELRRVAAFAPRLGKPLRQFLQTIDDRKRSTERDPLARTTAPPAPDKTAYKEGQGFTGMEGLLNYVYYQTLGINGFDEFGHLLRITAFTAGPCSPYATNPTEAVRKQCASHLGPVPAGPDQPRSDGERDGGEGACPVREAGRGGRARAAQGRRARGAARAGPARHLQAPGRAPRQRQAAARPDPQAGRGRAAAFRGPAPGRRHRRPAPRLPAEPMRTRRATQSIAASPVLVGAVTVLVALVAVYLAYNANAGLPFVPTYDVRAQVPGGSNLVEANEVRIGGFRAGAVDRIRPGVARPGSRAGGQDRDARSVAIIEMKLDKRFEPIASDSRIQIRPRSALGLKYVDLRAGQVPGRSSSPAARCRWPSRSSRWSWTTSSAPSTTTSA